MKPAEEKVAQYLIEARATEDALVTVLRGQIAMTPRGSYRSALDDHLQETRRHSARIAERLKELDVGFRPLRAVIGLWEEIVGQTLALGKLPVDALRGSGGEEKVLKNAKDACAAEALEIATYTALERLARAVKDEKTAELAASIRAEEERMLERILREIPSLTDAVVRAELHGNGSYDLATTGLGQGARAAGAEAKSAAREVGEKAKTAARKTTAATKANARHARKIPGVGRVEGQIKGALADEKDLAIAHYDALTSEEITGRLSSLSQIDLAKVDGYERKNRNRTTVLNRVSALRTEEPWSGYDELTVAQVQVALATADEERITRVRSYEHAHKNRAGVIDATERTPVHA
jgi:ferritin-like metal-binding protein YciE